MHPQHYDINSQTHQMNQGYPVMPPLMKMGNGEGGDVIPDNKLTYYNL